MQASTPTSGNSPSAHSGYAVTGLLTAATVWGIVWYPYRLLEQAGLGGALATTVTYGIALLLGLPFFWRRLRHLRHLRFSPLLIPLALAAGGCNLGYVMAVLDGEVMRVLLLFYLSPLWTILLSRLLLGERLTLMGAGVIGVSLVGALVMLWHPSLGLPWPRNGAEWLGMAAGLCFALQNVLIRRAAELAMELKTLAVFSGVILLGLGVLVFGPRHSFPDLAGALWLTLLAIGVVLLVANGVIQFSLAALPANRASVIMLFELVVAALSSWLLAGEVMHWREWLGGGLIVLASAYSTWLEKH